MEEVVGEMDIYADLERERQSVEVLQLSRKGVLRNKEMKRQQKQPEPRDLRSDNFKGHLVQSQHTQQSSSKIAASKRAGVEPSRAAAIVVAPSGGESADVCSTRSSPGSPPSTQPPILYHSPSQFVAPPGASYQAPLPEAASDSGMPAPTLQGASAGGNSAPTTPHHDGLGAGAGAAAGVNGTVEDEAGHGGRRRVVQPSSSHTTQQTATTSTPPGQAHGSTSPGLANQSQRRESGRHAMLPPIAASSRRASANSGMGATQRRGTLGATSRRSSGQASQDPLLDMSTFGSSALQYQDDS